MAPAERPSAICCRSWSLTIGTHLVQQSVDEAYEVHVIFVEAESVWLSRERLLLRYHRIRVLRGEAGEHGVVASDGRHLALLEECKATRVVVRADRYRLRASLIRLSMLEVPFGAHTLSPSRSLIELAFEPFRTKIF